jgi:hypothetical protein
MLQKINPVIIIAATAYGDEISVQDCYSAGFQDICISVNIFTVV